MPRRAILVAVTLLALGVLAAEPGVAGAEERNLLEDGAFERAGSDGAPEGWQRSGNWAWRVQDAAARSGSAGVRAPATVDDAPSAILSEIVTVWPGESYTLTAWVRPQGPWTGDALTALVVFHDGAGRVVGSADAALGADAVTWKPLQVVADAPDEAVTAQVVLAVPPGVLVPADVDDVTLVGPVPPLAESASRSAEPAGHDAAPASPADAEWPVALVGGAFAAVVVAVAVVTRRGDRRL